MSNEADVGVTYTGAENPFKDRIYKTGLTFKPGQSRVLPPALAARFLRHTDVFRRTDEDAVQVEKKDPGTSVGDGDQITDPGKEDSTSNTSTSNSTEAAGKQVDDNPLDPDPNSTDAQLAAAQAEAEKQRQQEDARFELHMQVDKMDSEALRTFAKDKFGQAIHHKTGLEKAREQVKSMIDQYGVP